jgi:hypothetical protein
MSSARIARAYSSLVSRMRMKHGTFLQRRTGRRLRRWRRSSISSSLISPRLPTCKPRFVALRTTLGMPAAARISQVSRSTTSEAPAMRLGTVLEAGKQAIAAVFKAAATEVEEVPQTVKVVAEVAEAVVAVHPVDREAVSVASVVDEVAVAEDGDLSEVVQKEHLHQREASHKHHDCAASLLPSPLIPLLRAC